MCQRSRSSRFCHQTQRAEIDFSIGVAKETLLLRAASVGSEGLPSHVAVIRPGQVDQARGLAPQRMPPAPALTSQASEGTLMTTRRERTATMAAPPAPAACTRGVPEREVRGCAANQHRPAAGL